MYAKYFKRVLDFFLSLSALTVLSPLLLVLTVVGAFVMKGNPFFTQRRPGRKGKDGQERIFRLVKFRTMTCEKDADGNLLPDADRLTAYGKFLRNTSLDELPELLNILVGDMSLVGPRPLLVEYLPWYTEVERGRHDVRPGLTGWAQVNGRNLATWEEKFTMDVWYASNISFATDVKVVLNTVKIVLQHSGVELNAQEDFDVYRKHQRSAVADLSIGN